MRISCNALILCPLEIERRAAARVAQGRARVIATGVGSDRMRRCLNRFDPDSLGVVVLFGVAGGLCATCATPPIGRVVNVATGESWETRNAPCGGATIAGVDTPLLTVDAKRSLRDRTGASLVDTESHVFASICEAHGWDWTIIRGVSDGPDDVLPDHVSQWIDDEGRTRAVRVALDLLRRPALIPQVSRLGRSTRRALLAASIRLDALLAEDAATIPPA